MKKSELKTAAKCIQNNIQIYGLERYDPRDTRWNPLLLKHNCFFKLLRKGVLFTEEFFPILVRKAMRCEKKCWPTTIPFLVQAGITAKQNEMGSFFELDIHSLIEECLQQYVYPYKVREWWKDEPHIEDSPMIIDSGTKVPILSMHALARCNIMLLTYGVLYIKKEYIDIAVKTANHVIENNNTIDFNDGTVSISYYYNSLDCTININSEFAHWLSLIPEEQHNARTIKFLEGTINLVLSEQNFDGSWHYCSKWHIEKYKTGKKVDCHHTATVLFNLINILKCKYLSENEIIQIEKSIEKGIQFFIANFYDEKTGKGITEIGKIRECGAVQYSETIVMLIAYLKQPMLNNPELKARISRLLPLIMEKNYALINLKTGEVPSEKIIKPLYLNSIRWGNGPVLQSIVEYFSVMELFERDNES